jgi:hypothetical protein
LRENVERKRTDYDQKESAFHGLASRKVEKFVTASTVDAIIDTNAIGALARAESLSG